MGIWMGSMRRASSRKAAGLHVGPSGNGAGRRGVSSLLLKGGTHAPLGDPLARVSKRSDGKRLEGKGARGRGIRKEEGAKKRKERRTRRRRRRKMMKMKLIEARHVYY
jgi:hypothetical protein